MSKAHLNINAELLRDWLGLPESTKVLGSVSSLDDGLVRVLIEDDDIPSEAKEVAAQFSTTDRVTTFDKYLPVSSSRESLNV